MYNIISNNSDYLLISKEPGVNFHRDSSNRGLTEVIKEELNLKELFTVHRLDRITSGLLLFARQISVARDLSTQFRNRSISKYYLAISDSRPLKKQGLIKGDMAKSRRGSWKLLRSVDNPAVTQFFSCSCGKGLRLYLLRPRSGKTHQIRVAMKSIGAPIVGDPVYSKKTAKEHERAYLHAYALKFQLGGKEHKFVSKPDTGKLFAGESFSDALKKYADPWTLNWPHI